MGRIRIELPKEQKFQTEIPVRISDINYGGHVGNDSILSIMHEVRLRYLQSLGFESEVAISGAVGIIVADAAIQYKGESFYGDELEATVFVDDFNKYGFDIYYQLVNKHNHKEIARGKTGIVCLDYDKKQLVTIPSNLKSKLG